MGTCLRWLIQLLAAVFVMAPSAQAGDLCNYYRSHAPELYKLLCSTGKPHPAVAGGGSTFSQGFNINPGSLPTDPTSYGLEAIVSQLRSNTSDFSPTFSLIKGYNRIGTGISTAASNTFYSNDILQRTKSTPLLTTFKPIEQPVGHVTNLNVGAAIGLWSNRKAWTGNLGLSLRYNYTTNTIGGGPGLLLASAHLSFGIGVTQEKVSNYLPSMYFVSALASARAWIFELQYQLLVSNGGLGLSPINIGTLTARIRRLMLTAALRELSYSQYGDVTQEHFAAQYLLSQSLSLGLLYNYIPGATSLALQYYL